MHYSDTVDDLGLGVLSEVAAQVEIPPLRSHLIKTPATRHHWHRPLLCSGRSGLSDESSLSEADAVVAAATATIVVGRSGCGGGSTTAGRSRGASV